MLNVTDYLYLKKEISAAPGAYQPLIKDASRWVLAENPEFIDLPNEEFAHNVIEKAIDVVLWVSKEYSLDVDLTLNSYETDLSTWVEQTRKNQLILKGHPNGLS